MYKRQIWKKEYSLSEIVDPSQFKSYEDLKKRLNYVLGTATPKAPVVDESYEDESEGRGSFNDPDITLSASSSAPQMSPQESEDDALAYFQRLAEE